MAELDNDGEPDIRPFILAGGQNKIALSEQFPDIEISTEALSDLNCCKSGTSLCRKLLVVFFSDTDLAKHNRESLEKDYPDTMSAIYCNTI